MNKFYSLLCYDVVLNGYSLKVVVLYLHTSMNVMFSCEIELELFKSCHLIAGVTWSIQRRRPA